MIEIVGPSYEYRGERLQLPTCIFLRDHHYNEDTKSFALKQLLTNSVCDPAHHVIMSDHVCMHQDELSTYTWVYVPSFITREIKEFERENIHPDWDKKTLTFNFMINKPRLHRRFLLTLLDHFELRHCAYSLPWRRPHIDRVELATHCDNDHYKQIILAANDQVTGTDLAFGDEVVMDQGIRNGGHPNAQTYHHLLKTQVFEPAAISIITEPAFYERETIITEKTIMSIYAGTFPIWFGGWRIPDYLKQLGIDIFDDVIDHSYQHLADPWARCYEAVYRNLPLLRDPQLAIETNKKLMSRFSNNLRVLRYNPFYYEYKRNITSWPLIARIAARNLL